MRQAKPGDLAILLRAGDLSWVGRVVLCGDILNDARGGIRISADWMPPAPSGVGWGAMISSLLPITPDESITEEEQQEAKA